LLVSEASDDEAFISVPWELVADGLLDDVPSAWEVSDRRGAVSEELVSVVSNAVNITAGLVTIAVARREIATLARKIVSALRRRHESGSGDRPFSIRIDTPSGEVLVTADDEETVRVLAAELARMAGKS
jgi:hypothetical protein